MGYRKWMDVLNTGAVTIEDLRPRIFCDPRKKAQTDVLTKRNIVTNYICLYAILNQYIVFYSC